MRRQHLFEVEDLPWIPAWLRNLQTDFLRQMSTSLQIYRPIVPLLERGLQAGASRCIVDLCSGGGGPWGQLLEEGWEVTVTLTDLYPNVAAFARLQAACPERIAYCAEPVDAQQVPAHLEGMRILINGFHHFRPPAARAILADAVARRRAIGIFEIAERTPRTLLAALCGVPLLVFAITPWIRPLTCARLFWTYGVPLVPLSIVWDGLASVLRAYSREELAELTAATGGGYHWECGRLVPPFPGVPVNFLIGWPAADQSDPRTGD